MPQPCRGTEIVRFGGGDPKTNPKSPICRTETHRQHKNPIPRLSRAMLPAQHKKLGTGMQRGMETGSIHTA